MELDVRPVGDRTAVVAVQGRLTMTAAGELRTLLESSVADGRPWLVVDLAGTEFMDSSGLGALVAGLRAARTAGGDLRIACAGEQVRTVLELTTMDRVLRPHATVEEALGVSG